MERTRGATFRRRRKRAGLTLDQVAEQLGCSKSKLSRYEHGSLDLTFEEATAAARLFGVPLSVLALQRRPA